MILCFGTRPEWLKIKPLLNEYDHFKLFFTGQHEDLIKIDLSEDKLIRAKVKDYSGSRLNDLISSILIEFEKLKNENAILIQGDTASAFACALAAFNTNKKIFYLEAGLRSFDLENPYPEEGYRQMISRISSVNICPTELSKKNLVEEKVLGENIVVGNTILDNLLDSGVKIEISPDGSQVSVLNWGYGDLAEYVKLDDRNTVITEMGLSTAVDDNINYVKNNYGDDVGNALENIRAKNNRFFARTFPPEIYIPSWDYYKDNAVGMPEAMLETKKLKLTGDNRLQGMVYHGSPGLNYKGRAVNQILQNRLFSIQNSPSVEREYLNSMEGLLNKIMYETDINWLDPTKYRANMLNLNYMYTTSNPFLATSYAMGGNNGSVELLNSNAHDAFHTILNHTDVLNPEDVDTLNLIKEDLKTLGLSIQEQNGALRIVDVNTGIRPHMTDPGVMQIKFDVPGNAILHTDMPLTRQLKNPNVPKLLKNIINNLQVDNILTEETIDDLIYNLIDTMNDKQNVYLDMDDTMQSSIAEQLVAGVNDPQGKGAATRQTVKNYYNLSLKDKNKLVQNKIETILKEGSGTLRSINDFITSNLYAQEAISQKGFDDALKYVNSFGDDMVTSAFFVNKKNTAGHALFVKNLNDTFDSVKRINFDVAFSFANGLPIESLGGSYSATRDLFSSIDQFDRMIGG